MFITIIAFLFVFSIITIVHEGGHLIASKRAGIRVHEFGLGFGPTIFSTMRNGTIYKINLLPILGYINIAGINTEDPQEKETPENEKFYNKSLGKKVTSIIAGPLMNLLSGFLIFSLIFMIMGIPTGISNEISTISPGSEAAKVGLKPGDRLLMINGETYSKPEDAIKFIHENQGKELALKIGRNSQELLIKATPQNNTRLKAGLIGFALKATYKKVNPLVAIYSGLQQTLGLVMVILVLFGRLLVGKLALADLAGPVGIAQITGQYAQSGLLALLGFLAFFSINVAVLNLLPLPALDGGRLFFLGLEFVRRKAVPIELENKIHSIGLFVFLGLFALLTVNDLMRIFRH
ncbi:RIP metalloprotease RseP [candidate division WOR-1 bacterium RIFOXYD2_FULL_41_8]|nr:MAG: RIP metalloprotease RseP [candidate division WOR-1 bacterium RIFOXYD2_FULL_41_8]